MFQLIDTTLQNLLTAELQPPVLPKLPTICFMTPDAAFPGTVTLPALNLFLFATQENRELRTTEPLQQRRLNGSVELTKAPARIDCHYLVTAYAAVPETQPDAPHDEHWILGETMRALLRFPMIPERFWASRELAVDGLPLQAAAALPNTREMGIDLWQALGRQPRACFHYRVTANMAFNVVSEVVAPVTSVVLGPPA